MDFLYGLVLLTILQMTHPFGHAEGPLGDMDQGKVYTTTPPAQTSELDRTEGSQKDAEDLNITNRIYASQMPNRDKNSSNDLYSNANTDKVITKDDDDIINDEHSGSHVTEGGPPADIFVSNETLVNKLVEEFKAHCDSNYTGTPNDYCSWILSKIQLLNGGILPIGFKEVVKLNVCAGVLYHASANLCCGGKLHRLTSQEGCCNNTLFSRRTQMCCHNSLHVTSPDRPLKCCGRFLYNPSEQFCCGDVLHLPKNTSMCCGITAIDLRCEACINSTAIQLSNNSHCTHHNISESDFNDTLTIQGPQTKVEYKPIKYVPAIIMFNGVAIATGVYFLIRRGKFLPKDNDGSRKSLLTIASCSQGNNTGHVINDSWETHSFMRNNTVLTETSLEDCPEIPSEQCTEVLSENCQALPSELCRHDLDEEDPEATQMFPDIQLNDNYFTEDEKFVKPDIHSEIQDFLKTNQIPTINCIDNHFINVQTQTNDSKASNKQTVFGTKFQHSAILTSENQTFKMPGSDVEVVFPSSLTKLHGLEVHGSSFYSISDIRRRFALHDDEAVASPVTEYHVTGYDQLTSHACVKMPFIGQKDELNVYKFQSDEGLTKTTKRVPIPRKDSKIEDLDMFFEIEGSTCLIYTRSFSGFICCTTCHGRPLTMRAYLYASHKRIPTHEGPRNEIRIRMYIADELLKFKDYKQRLEDNEGRSGRQMKEDKLLELLDDLRGKDLLDVLATPRDPSNSLWMHMTSFSNRDEPIFQPRQIIRMADLVQSCPICPEGHMSHRDMPPYREWYLTNRPGSCPPDIFQCDVNVTSCRELPENHEKRTTILVIDELPLRLDDKLPAQISRKGELACLNRDTVERHAFIRQLMAYLSRKQNLAYIEMKFTERLRSIKDYVLSMDVNSRKKLMEQIEPGSSDVYQVFEKLQRHLKPDGLFTCLVGAFKKALLYKDLGNLFKCDMIPEQFSDRPVQHVQRESETRTDAQQSNNNVQSVYQATSQQPCNNAQRVSQTDAQQLRSNVPKLYKTDTQQPRNNVHPFDQAGVHRFQKLLLPSNESYSQQTHMPLRPEIGDELADISLLDSPNDPGSNGSTQNSASMPTQEHASLDETEVKRT